MCPEESILQAYLDGELVLETELRVAAHLTECNACRESLQALHELAGMATAALASYQRETAATECSVRVSSLSHLPYCSRSLTTARRFVNMFQRYKWFAGATASVLALAVFLSWAPGRSLAAQFLNIFRMEKIQVVEITPEDMFQLEKLFNGRGGEVDIRNFGRVEVIQPAEWIVKADPSQVESLSGLDLDLPSSLSGRERAQISIEQPPTIIFTPDVESLNSYLRRRGTVLLPSDLAGKSFTLNIPAVVQVQYGQTGDGFALHAARDLTIDAPQGVDPASLRRALLALPFLPENLRRQLAAINDWQHTLPIPATRGIWPREITVNGNQGVYFTEADSSKVILAWRQGDSWRAISGLPLEEALRAAAEVR